MALTLEELKAQNRAAEDQSAKALDKELQEQLKKSESEQKPEQEAADAEDDEEVAELLRSDGVDTSDDAEVDEKADRKFTDSDVAAVRRKLKGKLNAAAEKANSLEAKVAELEARLQEQSGRQESKPVAAPQKTAKMPRLIDYAYNEDKYEEAMAEWVQRNALTASQRQASQSSQADAQRQAMEKAEKAVSDHYLRADQMSKKFGIAPEVYQSADTAVRQTVESVIPKGGDAIVDGIIARLGEGSEKVIYLLGRNKSKRDQFEKSLREDPSGIAAAIMLGQLKNDLSSGKNKSSNAPKPSSTLSGDTGGTTASATKLKRQYEKTTDLQTRIDLKRSAKQKGIDVSGW